MRIPAFFVPAATIENQDSVYASLAQLAHRGVPAPAERIFSITYLHDGEEWTATVGENLKGVRLQRRRSRGRVLERTMSLTDRATVLAIFAGLPYVVVTNQYLAGNIGSQWENPFFVGSPHAVNYFSDESDSSADLASAREVPE